MKLFQKIINFFTRRKVVKPEKINLNKIQCLYGPPPSFANRNMGMGYQSNESKIKNSNDKEDKGSN